MSEDTIVRASSLPSYADCALRYAADNLRAEISALGYDLRHLPTGIAAANGTAVHAGAAHILRAKIETGEYGDLADAAEIAHASLADSADKDEIAYDALTPTMNAAEQQVLRQTRAYHEYVAPTLEPVAVERELRARIKPGFLLVGHLDVAAPLDLNDTKTGRVSRNHAGQLGAYALLERTHRRKANRLFVNFVQRVPMNKPQPRPVLEEYDAARAERVATRTIKRIVDDIETLRRTGEPEAAFLPNPSSMLCSDKWCRAWGTQLCSAWRRKDS